MKRYTEYSVAELAAADGDELKKLIAIECAVEGVSTLDSQMPERPRIVEQAIGRTVVKVENLVVSPVVAECIRGLLDQYPADVFDYTNTGRTVKPEEWAYPKFYITSSPTEVDAARQNEARVSYEAELAMYREAGAAAVAVIENEPLSQKPFTMHKSQLMRKFANLKCARLNGKILSKCATVIRLSLDVSMKSGLGKRFRNALLGATNK